MSRSIRIIIPQKTVQALRRWTRMSIPLAAVCLFLPLAAHAQSGSSPFDTNSGDQSVLKREKWTATVTYVFNPQVSNEKTTVDPLGLTIIRFRVDQAFS